MYQPELTPQEMRRISVLTDEHESRIIDFIDRQREAIEMEQQLHAVRREMIFDALCLVSAVVIAAAVCVAMWAR